MLREPAPEGAWTGLGTDPLDPACAGVAFPLPPPPVPFAERDFTYIEAIPSLGPAPVGILTPHNS